MKDETIEQAFLKKDDIEFAEHIIEVVQGFLDGKPIECLLDDGRWVKTESPAWDFEGYDYRIATPTPLDEVKNEVMRLQKEYSKGKSAEAKYRCEAYAELIEFINTLNEEE